MDMLKKFFPLSFKYTDSVANLIIGIIIYLVAGAVAGAVIGLLAGIPIVGFIFGLIGSQLGIYVTAGIVIQVLVFCKVLK